VGFHGLDGKDRFPIATGKWGCGAFKGDAQLKFIIQWLAASRIGREMIFFTGNDEKLDDAGKTINKFRSMCIGDLLNIVELYEKELLQNNFNRSIDLFSYLLESGKTKWYGPIQKFYS